MRPATALLLALLLAAPAVARPLSVRLELPAQTPVLPASEAVLTMQILELVGFDTVQAFKFALEYDAARLQILELRPGAALAGWPAQDFRFDSGPGRASVVAITGTPVPVAAGAFVLVRLRMSADLYAGERPVLRVRGALAPEPVQFLATIDGEPVKVGAPDAGLFVSAGVSCLAGDALADGGFDAGDAVAILRIVTGLIPTPGAALRCGADADADGSVRAGDAVITLRRAIGLGDAAGRATLSPTLHAAARAGGVLLRIAAAADVHGFELGIDGQGLRFGRVEVAAADLLAQNVSDDRVRVAGASARSLADAAGEWAVFVETIGAGRVRFEEVLLFGADGAELYSQREALELAVGTVPRTAGPRLGSAPNPFNPQTTIWMELSVADQVRLDLFDMRGRHLARLLDEVRPAGRSTVRLEAGERALPSGVYFARLRTRGGAAVHRMTLLR